MRLKGGLSLGIAEFTMQQGATGRNNIFSSRDPTGCFLRRGNEFGSASARRSEDLLRGASDQRAAEMSGDTGENGETNPI